jgi:ribA/ribD-fused uncharacterized protein
MINRFDGRYSFLSNFYPCKIEHQGITYPSVEAFYVAMKCNSNQTFDGVYYTPVDFREMIAKIPSPGRVKKIGQRIKVRPDWDSKKLEFMTWAVNEKFKDPTLKEMLIMTGDVEIIEGNWWHDVFWGQCTCEKCAGKGKNKLGKLLMEVRSELNGTKKPNLYDVLFPKK